MLEFSERGIVAPPRGLPGSADTLDQVSRAIWEDCDFTRLVNGNGGRARHWAVLNAIGQFSVDTIGTGSPTLTYPNVDKGEMLLTAPSAAAGDGAQLYHGASNSGAFITPSSTNKIWFEARVKVSQIATPQQVFVGLAQVGASGVNGLWSGTTNGQLILNAIGFKTPTAAATAVLGTITQNGVTESGNSEINAGVKTLVADTYVKLGLKLDNYVNGAGTAVQRVQFFVDGVVCANVHTTKIPTNPLTPSFGLYRSDSSASTGLSVSWARVAVEDTANAGQF